MKIFNREICIVSLFLALLMLIPFSFPIFCYFGAIAHGGTGEIIGKGDIRMLMLSSISIPFLIAMFGTSGLFTKLK